MAAVGVGIQVASGVISIIKAWTVYRAQNPSMTEEQALLGFANGVSDFNVAIERWDNTEVPPQA
jgi:hypothetical protein